MRTRLFTLLLSLLCTSIVHAQKFNVDGLNYEVTSSINNEVAVVSGDYITDPFVIPSTVSYDGVKYTVTSIGDDAFCRSSFNFSSIVFPESLKSIGNTAFSGCSSLSSVTFSEGLTDIGIAAFSDCSSLSSVTFPESLINIGGDAFLNCSSLTSVVFPENLTSIGDYAFRWCTSLSSVTFSEGLTSIGDYAFSQCLFLSSVVLPNSLTSIGELAFSDCPLESIDVSAGNQTYLSIDGVLFTKDKTSLLCYPQGRKSTSYEVPHNVSNIADYAFYSCSSLSSVTLPESLTDIGYGAFYACIYNHRTTKTNQKYPSVNL